MAFVLFWMIMPCVNWQFPCSLGGLIRASCHHNQSIGCARPASCNSFVGSKLAAGRQRCALPIWNIFWNTKLLRGASLIHPSWRGVCLLSNQMPSRLHTVMYYYVKVPIATLIIPTCRWVAVTYPLTEVRLPQINRLVLCSYGKPFPFWNIWTF